MFTKIVAYIRINFIVEMSDISIDILIIEKDDVVKIHLERMLSRLGFNIVGITSHINEAVNLIEQKMPELIISNVSVEDEMDGIELAKVINEHFNIPFIFITNKLDKSTAERIDMVKPLFTLFKPLDHEIFVRKMQSIYTTLCINKQVGICLN